MNADLLRAHALFSPLNSQGLSFDHAYREAGLVEASGGGGDTKPLSAERVRQLADQAVGSATQTETKLSSLLADRRALVAVVAVAHDGLLAAHEIFKRQVAEGEVDQKYEDQVKWVVSHGQALSDCCKLSATILDFESHSSILDPAWRDMDWRNKELMARLHKTLLSSMRLDALTAQARKYGRFAEQETQRLAEEQAASARGLEQASAKLSRLAGSKGNRSLSARVADTATLLGDTAVVELLDTDKRLHSEATTLLRNVIKLTAAPRSKTARKTSQRKFSERCLCRLILSSCLIYCFLRNGAERGAVADIHRRAVKLDQDLRKVHFDVHTLCVNAVTTCTTLAKFAQPLDSKGGPGEGDEHSALTAAGTDPLAMFNELIWKHPEHSQTTSTTHTIAPEVVWLAAAQQQQTSESSPGVLESTLKAGIDHSIQFARRLVGLGNLATRQATAGGGELEGAVGGGEDGDVDADDDADAMQEPTADDAGAAEASAAAVAVEAREERSTYALAVLRRVRYKLDGRDTCSLTRMLTEGDRSLPVEGKGLSVSEHVDRIITEAIAPDNLALMYEGWAAWI